MKKLSILTNGILKENPVLKLVLGTCPTLAVTTMASNGIGMGLAATFVLICSNVVISLLRKVIPKQVRIPAYITVIAAFVTVVQMLVKAYFPDLDKALGIFLPLITVNCIILGRAEMFASKNTVVDAAIDGVGMGLGFTLTLTIMASIRELIGAGTLFGARILPEAVEPMAILISPPGGFFVFGIMMAAVVFIESKKGRTFKPEAGCESCPAANVCQSKGECDQ